MNLISKAIENKERWAFSEYGFNYEGCMFKVNTNDWATQFNHIINESLILSVDRFTNTFTQGGGMLGPNIKSQIVNFWEFYDRLAYLGLGYYVPWITKAGKVFMHFKIIKKVYENREQIFTFLEDLSLPELDEISKKSQKIREKEESKKSWNKKFI